MVVILSEAAFQAALRGLGRLPVGERQGMSLHVPNMNDKGTMAKEQNRERDHLHGGHK